MVPPSHRRSWSWSFLADFSMPLSDRASSTSSTPVREAEQEECLPGDTTQSATQRYRAIRPRLPVTTTVLPSRSRKTPVTRPGSCGIPQCLLLPCPLPSHHHYARSRSHARRGGQLYDSSHRSSPLTSLSNTPAPESSLDTLVTFPFEQPFPPELHRVFHYWTSGFLDKYDPVYQICSRHGSRDVMIQLSLTEEIFAVTALAYAKSDLLQLAEEHSFDGVTNFLQSKLAQIVRERLQNFQPSDVEVLVFCVVAMANFDIQKRDVLENHRLALQHLIAARGGVHNLLGSSGGVLQADRRLAVIMEKVPAFDEYPEGVLDESLSVSSSRYGAAFFAETTPATLDAEVSSFCRNASALIHWFEDNKISFDIKDASSTEVNKLPYFHFTRDRVSSHFAHIFADLAKRKDKSRCVLVATNLVVYPIVNGDCMSQLTEHLASKLTEWLMQDLEHGVSREWQGHSDMLTWILWVLVILKVRWPTKTWVRVLLKETLKSVHSPAPPVEAKKKNGNHSTQSRKAKGKEKSIVSDPPSRTTLRAGWREEQWNKNMRWTWSRDHLRERFDKFCEYIEKEED